MSNPIEVMAKATYDEFVGPMRAVEPAWDGLPDSHRNRMMESARAALLALSDCDLPEEVINAGALAAYHTEYDEEYEPADYEIKQARDAAVASIRAMLKQLAENSA